MKPIEEQLKQCVDLFKGILDTDLLGMYLYGSAVGGGLQKYSDIDLFVVSNRATTSQEKIKLATNLLSISGIYKVSSKRPVEVTVVVQSEVNPWHYPPQFDFQYGDWLRSEFETGNCEPWETTEMPDLALLITQVLLANKLLWGTNADQLLGKIPQRDCILATIESLKDLMTNLHSDTRNVLLTLARIWYSLTTDQMCSKSDAADWTIDRLPKEFQFVMAYAKAIYLGNENDEWHEAINQYIEPCAQCMVDQINKQIALIDGAS